MQAEQKMKLLENLLEINSGSIKQSTHLDCIESWDSLNVLAFITMADEKFGVIPTAEELEDAITVGDLFKILEG